MSNLPDGLNQKKIKKFFKTAHSTAMILIRDETVIAKHGPLSPEGFQQFADALQRHWRGWDQGDHDRFVVRMHDGQFQCLGAKCIPSGDYLLGLAFPMDIPLKHMRRDVADLTQLVTTFDEETDEVDDRLEQSLQLTGQPMSQPDPPATAKPVPAGWQIKNEMAGQLEDEIVPEEPLAQTGTPENKPVRGDQDSHWQPLDALLPAEGGQAEGDLVADPGIDHRVDHLTAQLGGPAVPSDDDLVSILQGDEHDLDQNPVEDWQSPAAPAQFLSPIINEDTRPVSCEEDVLSLAETVMDTTFYLVPRLNDHYLLGELALQLREWFPALCEIYGWELASLSVRPDYLKWTLLDFPECLIRDMLGVVRHWTSNRIFTTFPGLQSGNPTQDFWSPGYLVDTQNREFPTQVLISHVSRSRMMKESPVGSSFN